MYCKTIDAFRHAEWHTYPREYDGSPMGIKKDEPSLTRLNILTLFHISLFFSIITKISLITQPYPHLSFHSFFVNSFHHNPTHLTSASCDRILISLCATISVTSISFLPRIMFKRSSVASVTTAVFLCVFYYFLPAQLTSAMSGVQNNCRCHSSSIFFLLYYAGMIKSFIFKFIAL